MTTPGYTQALSPSISMYKPAITPSTGAYDVDGEFIETITGQISRYSHTIEAVGGYWKASFQIDDRLDKIEDWIDNGLGRHIVVHDHALNVIWEGVVNRVSANISSLAIMRGPLFNADNRVFVYFSELEGSPILPPAIGASSNTDDAEDEDSQERYGILEAAVTSGPTTAADALEVRNQYLAERAWPRTTQSVNTGRAGTTSVKVDCIGYVNWFNKYIYNQVASSTPIDLDVHLQNIINAQLNDIIETSMAEIEANTIEIVPYEDKSRTAMAVIMELLAFGNATDDRFLFGVYANQVPVYAQAPTTLEYQMRLAEPEQVIETMQGARVYPWNVLPGKWLLFSDLLVAKMEPSNLLLDPRAMFIESVTYRAPWGLTMKGGDTDKLSQKLAKMGVYGLYMGPGGIVGV